jgi:hypothetical protein
MLKMLYATIIAATLVACTSVRPVAIQAGDRCLRCRVSIGDLRVAGEIIDHLRAPFPFRTTGCLAKYVKAHSGEPFTAIFVTDFQSGRLIEADAAWFVPAKLAGPDGRQLQSDYLAFRSRSDADAARAGQPLLRWSQVVAEATAN